MSNQASGDELVTEVTDILNNNLHASCECYECIITWSDSDAIPLVVELIRTEKLKLLDEVIHQSTVNLKSAKAVAGWAELRKKQLEAEL